MKTVLPHDYRAGLAVLLLGAALPDLPGQRELPTGTESLISSWVRIVAPSETISKKTESAIQSYLDQYGLVVAQAATEELCDRLLKAVKDPNPATRAKGEFFESLNVLFILLRLQEKIGTRLDERSAASLRTAILDLWQSGPTPDQLSPSLVWLLGALRPNKAEIVSVLGLFTSATIRFHDQLVKLGEVEGLGENAPILKRLPSELEWQGQHISAFSHVPYSQFSRDTECKELFERSRRAQRSNLDRLMSVDGPKFSIRRALGVIKLLTAYATFCAQCEPATQNSAAEEIVGTLHKTFPALSPEDAQYLRGGVVCALTRLPLKSIGADQMFLILTALKSELQARLEVPGPPIGICVENAFAGQLLSWCKDPQVVDGITERQRGKLVDLLRELEAITLLEPERGKEFVAALKKLSKD